MKMAGRFLIAIAAVALVASTAAAQKTEWITKDELRSALGSPDLAIIDVRIGKDWDASDVIIKGAVREDYKYVNFWAKKYPKDRRLVLY